MAQRPKSTGLMSRNLIHTAATLHYADGLPQVEVARRMQMSTATVSRLLARARAEGIVRIEVLDLETEDGLSEDLATALGLWRARVVDSAAALSGAVGMLIREADLPQTPVVAIGWGRAVSAVLAGGLPHLPGAVVVPTTGGMHQSELHFQINEFARTAAEQMAGEAHLFYAPAQPGAALFAQLIRNPQIAMVMDLWNRVDVAVTGIGTFADKSAENAVGFTSDEAARVVGDVVRQYFDRDGAPVPWPGQDSQMGIGHAQLTRIPLCIGVCAGSDKVAPAIGAARSGMITTLVTDNRTAQSILEHLAAE